MNAGAYGGHMQQIVTKIKACDTNGEIVELTNAELDFGYRQSLVRSNKLTVLSCELELIPAQKEEIKEKMDILSQKRRSMQPLSLPSCGSVFKRPEGHFAGALIEQSGLKGFAVGGAQVSEKHAGFVINRGGATAQDICRLSAAVQKKVLETFGVQLEPEVRFVGEFLD